MNLLLELKTCVDCAEAKSPEEFYRNKRSKDGRANACVCCYQIKNRAWRKANKKHIKLRARLYSIQYKYNITIDQYHELLVYQDHKCAICRIQDVDATYGSLCVDHCHGSGKVRGLLCHNCNAGLGHYRESCELLQRAISYLGTNR